MRPIISKETYDKTQEELKIRQRTALENLNPRPFQAKYMLSGIGQCGYCLAPLKIIMGVKRKDGTRFVKYECHQRHPRKTSEPLPTMATKNVTQAFTTRMTLRPMYCKK